MMRRSGLLSTLTLLSLTYGCIQNDPVENKNQNPVANYCDTYPNHYGCPGYQNTEPISNNPNKNDTCTSPTGSGYDLRRGQITFAGRIDYIPGMANLENFSHNISNHLITTRLARDFYAHDARLKIRFLVKPQPTPIVGTPWCYNRKTGDSADPFKYGELKFDVSLVGLNSDGSIKRYSSGFPMFENTLEIGAKINQCTQVVSFSGNKQRHPYGMVVAIHNVRSNQDCDREPCSSFNFLRSSSCWQMEIQVSVDETKDIN